MSATDHVRIKVAGPEKIGTDFLKHFDEVGDFPESCMVRLGFRTTVMAPEEHYLNRWAVHLTYEFGEKAPFGSMCHLELLIQLKENVWIKMSVSKLQCNDGVWSNGCVHMLQSDPAEWKKRYIFLCVHADRAAIKKMLTFYQMQNNNKFNATSYYGALLGGLGVDKFHTRMLSAPHPDGWYCTECIVAALQCLVQHMKHQNSTDDSWQSAVLKMRCSTTNPNKVFRVLAHAYGVTNAFKPGVAEIEGV